MALPSPALKVTQEQAELRWLEIMHVYEGGGGRALPISQPKFYSFP